MKRVVKHPGLGNIAVEDTAPPTIGPTQVLIRAQRSLISRGSEIWRRYIRPEAVDHQIMGYSLAGIVEAVGAEVQSLTPGDRVAAD